MANVCPICGNPTALVYGKYPRKDGLCQEHGTQANKGGIIQCEDCGKWYNASNFTCECKTLKIPPNAICLICGKEFEYNFTKPDNIDVSPFTNLGIAVKIL